MSESQVQFPYYLPSEVAVHNRPDDCWHSCRGCVYDVSGYVTEHPDSPLSKQLIAYGGKDVGFWFDAREEGRANHSLRLRRYVEPATGLRQILLPFAFPKPERGKTKLVPVAGEDGCCCGCCAQDPEGDVEYSNDTKLTGNCWSELEYIFNSPRYRIGWLTKNARPCRITNVLTGQRSIISVCEEDSIRRIQERALILNKHGASYTWKFEGKPLDMCLTLTENCIADERDRYLDCGLPDDATTYIPNLLCYYNDDLTEL